MRKADLVARVVPFALVVAAACAATPPSPPVAPVPVDVGPHAVATENEQATGAAMTILQRGGPAADAAIAAALTLGVVVPVSSGIGGGGFAMVWDAKTKTTTVVDFREVAPAKFDPALLEQKLPPRGALTGVPGEARGLAELHERWGKLPLSVDASRAAEIAETGWTASRHVQRALDRFGLLTHDIGPMLPTKDAPAKNPALARTLRAFGERGADAFYQGPIAKCVADAVQANGGAMTEGDLRDYRVVIREPLRTTWGGFDVAAMPPPSGGGLTLFELLGTMRKDELAAMAPDSVAYAHAMGEIFRGVYADRARHVADPSFGGADVRPLASPERMARRRAAWSPDTTKKIESYLQEDHGTTHLVVVDGEGNVVTLTTTVNNPFGGRFWAPDCGVLLNDELDDFQRASKLEAMGVKDGPGVPKPGARPPSSMSPTIAFQDGRPVLAAGGSGGLRIATGVAQLVALALARGESPADILARPRLHVAPTGALVGEPGQLAPIADKLKAIGEEVKEEENLSGIQAIAIAHDAARARLSPASDPRKFGKAAVSP